MTDLKLLKSRVKNLGASERIEAILGDQRRRADVGKLIPVEAYFLSIDSLEIDDPLVIDLIYNEFLLRSEVERLRKLNS